MDLDRQKNFYDNKRYFQGKDNPGDAHPETTTSPVPRGQIIFGVVFILFVLGLFALRIKDAREELGPAGQPVTAEPIKATK